MKRHRRTPSGSKRRTPDDPALSMNSLMDIMTIILCFLLHSYGDSPIVVNASPDLQVARSSTLLSPEDSLTVTITRKAIVVGDKLVVLVENGEVSKGRRGSAPSLYIPPLFDRLSEEVRRHEQIGALKREPWNGVLTLVVDRTTPTRIIQEVMYTAGQAKLSRFEFAVVKNEKG